MKKKYFFWTFFLLLTFLFSGIIPNECQGQEKFIDHLRFCKYGQTDDSFIVLVAIKNKEANDRQMTITVLITEKDSKEINKKIFSSYVQANQKWSFTFDWKMKQEKKYTIEVYEDTKLLIKNKDFE